MYIQNWIWIWMIYEDQFFRWWRFTQKTVLFKNFTLFRTGLEYSASRNDVIGQTFMTNFSSFSFTSSKIDILISLKGSFQLQANWLTIEKKNLLQRFYCILIYFMHILWKILYYFECKYYFYLDSETGSTGIF